MLVNNGAQEERQGIDYQTTFYLIQGLLRESGIWKRIFLSITFLIRNTRQFLVIQCPAERLWQESPGNSAHKYLNYPIFHLTFNKKLFILILITILQYRQ